MSVEISMHDDGMNNLVARMYTKWSEEQDAAFRAALARAWDEGHTHCFHVENPHNPIKGNPYREETE